MAFVTYVLLVGVSMGLADKFHPQKLGLTSSSAMIFTLVELVIVKLGCYFLNIGTELRMLEAISYLGYKYVGYIFVYFQDNYHSDVTDLLWRYR